MNDIILNPGEYGTSNYHVSTVHCRYLSIIITSKLFSLCLILVITMHPTITHCNLKTGHRLGFKRVFNLLTKPFSIQLELCVYLNEWLK